MRRKSRTTAEARERFDNVWSRLKEKCAEPAAPLVSQYKTFTQTEWLAEGKRIFGDASPTAWVFVCPLCGNRQTMEDFEKANEPDVQRCYEECIGRLRAYKGRRAEDLATKPAANGVKSPCDYAAFGLIRLGHTVTMDADPSKSIIVFPFAEDSPK